MNIIKHCVEPCDLAQAIAAKNCAEVCAIHQRGNLTPEPSSLLALCPVGLTAKQAVVITAYSSRQGCITSHAEMASLLKALWGIETTKVAVREIIDKLRKRKFFSVCEAAYEGVAQGMCIIFSSKCCSFLRLPHASPLTLPHTPALAPTLAEPHAPTHSPTRDAPQALDASPTASPPHASLLQNEEEAEEEKGHFSFEGKETELLALTKEFFQKAKSEFIAGKWPNLLKVGFGYPNFVNAVRKSPDIPLLLDTWRESLDYADFAWRTPERVKDGKGKQVITASTWIAGCFKRDSGYPRPAGYKTPAEEAQEAARKAEAERQRQQDEARCHAAFLKWKELQTDQSIREIFGNFCPKLSAEAAIERQFRIKVWSSLSEEERRQYA